MEQIGRAALKIVDEEGLRELTMRRLAEALGTGPASLYRHVSSRDDLLVEVADLVLAELDAPDPGLHWREALEQLAHGLRRVLVGHRGLVVVSSNAPLLGPHAMRIRELFWSVMDRDGCEAEFAVQTYSAVMHFVVCSALFGAGAARQGNTPWIGEKSSGLDEVLDLLPARRYPTVLKFSDHAGTPDPEQDFRFGLRALLDGLWQFQESREHEPRRHKETGLVPDGQPALPHVRCYRARVTPRRLSRRSLLGAAAVGALGAGIEAGSSAFAAPVGCDERGSCRPRGPRSGRIEEPGSLPNPAAPIGTDQVPQIEYFTVVMMENHSFDNILGMLGRGDCFPRGANGQPTISLPDGHGNLVHAFHMPSECQTNGVGQNWNLAHHSLVHGNRGFVEGSTGEAVGYFLGEDLPFTWDMARTFPIADRWFSSLLGQTDPNRRYLMAGTSLGQVADGLNKRAPTKRHDLRHPQSSRHHVEGLLLERVFNRRLAASALRACHYREHQHNRPVLRRCSRRHTAAVFVRRAQLLGLLGGKSSGHPVRRPVPRRHRQRDDVGPPVEEIDADMDLRRMGRLVRPRRAARRHTA